MSGDQMLRRHAVVALLAAVPACSWFTDFKDQPKIEPWESVADSVPPRGNPQNSVPVNGALVPGFLVSRQPLPGTVDSMAGLANPVPADARSLENGRKHYQINCTVCHGVTGQGNGPVSRYGMPPIPLVSDRVRGLSDGYIWGMIRNGRGLMPSYNRIEELERWDVVNYIRGLQGRYPVDTTMPPPGVTGDALPGASVTAPTRPAPYFNAVRAAAGAGGSVRGAAARPVPTGDTTAGAARTTVPAASGTPTRPAAMPDTGAARGGRQP